MGVSVDGESAMTDNDVHAAVIKSAPPAIVFASGLTLNDLVAIVTIVYVVLQGFFLIRDKWWRQRGRK